MSFEQIMEKQNRILLALKIYREAWLAERAYHSNNTGENSLRRKVATASAMAVEKDNAKAKAW